KTHQFSSAKGRVRRVQFSGESHANHAKSLSRPAASPGMRGRSRTVKATREMPLAVPVLSLVWAAAAPRAAQIHPAAAKESPSAREPGAGSPKARRTIVTTAANARLAPNTATNAAVSGALRPMVVEA